MTQSMTPPTMSPENQRIAIAEACGLKRIHVEKDDDGSDLWANADFQFIGSWKTGAKELPYHGRVPDYLNSLDAMAEAEKVIEEKCLCVEYVNTLRDFAIYPKTLSRYGLTHATAPQRAEAVLRTLGKWEDGK